MGLLQKLKSALGLDASGSPSAGTNAPQDVDVTVEREPSTESEDAVKGTETDTSEEPHGDDSAEATPAEVAETEDAIDEAESADETAETEAESVTDNDAPVIEIKGIGPAYAERLENAGVSTVSDLAVADADELADTTDLSPNRISGWIDQAKTF
jgi:predicted flap endonuclease-1-like 5' DNA nuclease